MTFSIIELNDSEIRVSTGKEIVLRSPGFAFVDNDKIELGTAAVRQARLQPRAVHNRYWKNLNQDPLQYPATHARHNADLAFAQLLAIHEQAGKPEQVIFAVPGTYSNEQLALLLGLVEASPLKAIGLVDTAIAAITPVAGSGNYVHIDMHLHQSVLTRVNVSDQVNRLSVQPIDGAGLTAIYDTTAHLIADLFIKQSRFDPQHHPETEQALYDQIPACLNSLRTRTEVSLEIVYKNTQHQAKLSSASLLQELQPLYRKIIEAVDDNDICLISHALGQLPGLATSFANAELLSEANVFETCLLQAEKICSEGSALNYVTRLPATSNPAISDIYRKKQDVIELGRTNTQTITHILHGHVAHALNQGHLYLSASGLISSDGANVSHCSIHQSQGRITVKIEGELAVFLNGRQLQHVEEVEAGDIISFTGSKTEYTFIHVGN